MKEVNYKDEYIKKMIKTEHALLDELKSYAKKFHIPIIPEDTANLLGFIANVKRPLKVLEIGTAIGYSAVIIAENTDDECIIDTVDRNIRIIDTARENIKKAGYEKRINVIAADAMDVFLNLDKKYDLIFLDGSKSKYVDFFPHCMRMLNKEGIIFSDNVLFRGLVTGEKEVMHRQKTITVKLKKYINTICSDERLKTVVLPVGDGVAISYKK